MNKLKEEKSPYLKQHQDNPVNWFAWNKSAHEQIPEFYATKMVFESQLDVHTGSSSQPNPPGQAAASSSSQPDPLHEFYMSRPSPVLDI